MRQFLRMMSSAKARPLFCCLANMKARLHWSVGVALLSCASHFTIATAPEYSFDLISKSLHEYILPEDTWCSLESSPFHLFVAYNDPHWPIHG